MRRKRVAHNRPHIVSSVRLRNSPAFVAIWLATGQLGAWMVPVDPASSSRDIETQLARVSPKIGFYATARAEDYRPGVADGNTLRTFALEETAADVRAGGRLRAGDGRIADAVAVEPHAMAPHRQALMRPCRHLRARSPPVAAHRVGVRCDQNVMFARSIPTSRSLRYNVVLEICRMCAASVLFPPVSRSVLRIV